MLNKTFSSSLSAIGNHKTGSSSFLLSSGDNRFWIASVSPEEFEFLCNNFLDPYLEYLKSHPNSLLPRFYGCVKVQCDQSVHRFVIINNPLFSPFKLSFVYSFRGIPLHKKSSKKSPKPDRSFVYNAPVFTDADVVEKKPFFAFDQETAFALSIQLALDATFLSSMEVLGYGLLIGVHQIENEIETSTSGLVDFVRASNLEPSIFQGEFGGILARDPDGFELSEVYFMGITTVLQRQSHAAMTSELNARVRGSSDKRKTAPVEAIIPPEDYSLRFLDFVSEHLLRNSPDVEEKKSML
eukprot:TRINITY_DN10655_c0_g4_i1.p1 TRINITY_DN10655_c0_g4~~TRINITY_DN10655_c0_g4_i1.p1  ORF type:complete len:297 (-),score=77.95 TRINITY_DN10655_c0_g4_i1:15-905(-)